MLGQRQRAAHGACEATWTRPPREISKLRANPAAPVLSSRLAADSTAPATRRDRATAGCGPSVAPVTIGGAPAQWDTAGAWRGACSPSGVVSRGGRAM